MRALERFETRGRRMSAGAGIRSTTHPSAGGVDFFLRSVALFAALRARFAFWPAATGFAGKIKNNFYKIRRRLLTLGVAIRASFPSGRSMTPGESCTWPAGAAVQPVPIKQMARLLLSVSLFTGSLCFCDSPVNKYRAPLPSSSV